MTVNIFTLSYLSVKLIIQYINYNFETQKLRIGMDLKSFIGGCLGGN